MPLPVVGFEGAPTPVPTLGALGLLLLTASVLGIGAVASGRGIRAGSVGGAGVFDAAARATRSARRRA